MTTTQIPWLDEIIEKSGLPELADLEGALMIYNQLACDSASVHTFRRYPIPYKLVGRSRRYLVADVVAFAKRRIDEAPRRVPPPRRLTPRRPVKRTGPTLVPTP